MNIPNMATTDNSDNSDSGHDDEETRRLLPPPPAAAANDDDGSRDGSARHRHRLSGAHAGPPPRYTWHEYALAAGFYSLCAASLLVINKASVTSLPSPAVVIAVQLVFSAFAARLLMACGCVDAEPLRVGLVLRFFPVALLFTLCLVTNVQALQATSVQTVIVMRGSSPIFVAFFDWKVLRTGSPSPATWACLLGILVGACIYCGSDAGFSLRSYTWPLLYFVSICAEMVCVKHIINTVVMTTWSRVYYTNVLGLLPTLAFGWAFHEFSGLARSSAAWWTWQTLAVVSASCVVGLGISFAGFHARKLLSATSFTVLGVANKSISIAASMLLFGKAEGTATPSRMWGSLAGLGLIIVCGTLYAKAKSASKPGKV